MISTLLHVKTLSNSLFFISVCNKFREMQFYIVHQAYVSPYRYSKFNKQVSPNCMKCKNSLGTLFHCLWECKNVEKNWILICEALSDVCKVTVKASPIMCLLGILPPPLQEHKDIIHPLFKLARKAIMNKWVGDSLPLYREWLFMIKYLISLEKLRFHLMGKLMSFNRMWEEPLRSSQCYSENRIQV